MFTYPAWTERAERCLARQTRGSARQRRAGAVPVPERTTALCPRDRPRRPPPRAGSPDVGFSAHTLRHTCLTRLVRAGNDIVWSPSSPATPGSRPPAATACPATRTDKPPWTASPPTTNWPPDSRPQRRILRRCYSHPDKRVDLARRVAKSSAGSRSAATRQSHGLPGWRGPSAHQRCGSRPPGRSQTDLTDACPTPVGHGQASLRPCHRETLIPCADPGAPVVRSNRG